MRMDGQRQSDNVEDRRGMRTGGGGGFRLGGGVGIGTIVVALLAGWIFGINPLTVIGVLGGMEGSAPSAQTAPASPSAGPSDASSDPTAVFVRQVLSSTEDTWRQAFASNGGRYQDPVLVMFRGSTRTACGVGQSAMGPFYCPADQKVYIDLGFFDTLRQRMGAPGDFAQAYVIAHEVGHHVQHLLGITDKVDAQRQRVSEVQANALSVRVELQADCLAGVWAHQTRQRLEDGDVEEAINAAAQIGDDTLQRKSGGVVVPESFTHGSSAQRVTWFKRGMASGRVNDCDTFSAR